MKIADNKFTMELTNEEIQTVSNNITALYNLQNFTLPVFNIKSSADEESVSNISSLI